MSTKTTFKRIALVAVASLGFGLMSAAPSSAAENADHITAFNFKAATANVASINNAQTILVGLTTEAATNAGATDTITISGKITSYPVGGGVSVTAAAAADAAADGDANMAGTMTYSNTAPYGSCIQTATGGDGATLAATTTATAAGVGFCKFSFTPTVAGTYVFTVWAEKATAGTINDNEVSNTFSVTVGATGTALSLQFPNSADTTAAATGASLNGVKVSHVGIETVQVSGRTGIQVGFAPQYRLTRNGAAGALADASGTSNATKFATIAYSVTNPAGTAVTVVSAQGGTTASTSQAIAGSSTAISLGTNATAAENTVAKAQAISATTGWPQKGAAVYFSAATAGTYTITAFHDANLDTLVSVGEATTTTTVVIAADSLPSITMTTYGQSLPADAAAGNNLGHLVKISLKNGTTPASLGLSEVLTITGPTDTVIDLKSERNSDFKLAQVDAGDGVSVALTQANFDAAGNAYINVGVNAKGTHSLTAVITGGTGAGAVGSGSITVLDATLYPNTKFPDTALTYTNLTGVAGTGRTVSDAGSTYELTVKAGTATTVKIGAKPGAGITAKAYQANVTDNFGLITGLIGGTYTLYQTVGTTETTSSSVISWSVAVPAMASTVAADAVKLEINVDDAGTAVTARFDISQATAAATKSYSNPALDAASFSMRAGVASSNKLAVLVNDQFGNALPNISVSAVIAGRNATTVIPTLLTDAKGMVSYTLADVSTSTTSLTDTVTFTPAAGATSSVTINYATYLPAATITLTTPDSANATATGIAGSIKTDISSADGAEKGAVDVKAVLKDANGATLPAGIPVTFSVAGTGVAILSTHVTLYTDATGTVTSKVYGWVNGDRVVTATAGAVSASGTIYFRQLGTESETRTISAKANGNVVTATVTDRFGNPIKAASVTATRVGTGTFNGTSSITGTTDENGVVEFVLTAGTADVTVGFSSTTYGQTYATKGYVDAGITALTAYTAGTAVLAEEGVGASFDAAGVNSVKVLAVTDTATLDQATAATDAAAEATDAANAATDAANAAAEAADAATAAAQDAADAVAALSTQVAEMVDALKKQITALTNLVIKIQKKVRA
jgi:hypothetical protein